MAPLRITDLDGVVLDGGAKTQGLPSVGMQDGQEIEGVRPELRRFAFNDAKWRLRQPSGDGLTR